MALQLICHSMYCGNVTWTGKGVLSQLNVPRNGNELRSWRVSTQIVINLKWDLQGNLICLEIWNSISY